MGKGVGRGKGKGKGGKRKGKDSAPGLNWRVRMTPPSYQKLQCALAPCYPHGTLHHGTLGTRGRYTFGTSEGRDSEDKGFE